MREIGRGPTPGPYGNLAPGSNDSAVGADYFMSLPDALPMTRTISLFLALALGVAPLLATPARAQSNDRLLLSTFCEPANIKGATCKRAKNYPDAGKRACDVKLNADRFSGRFVAGGNPLLVVNYESGCEAHVTDNGGSVVFEQVGDAFVFRGLQPGMQAGDCIVLKEAQQDRLVCITGHMGQGIMETGVALMGFAQGPDRRITMSLTMLVSAEDSNGAFGSNVVTCKERSKYFELSKLAPGPRPGTVTAEASYADADIIKTACGKGFPKPKEVFGDLVPGDAYVPEGHEKHGMVTIDLVTKKVTVQ